MPVLQIRDKNGKFIPIPAVKGNDGKSAYEQAKEGGYTGTEEEFIALLNGLTSTEDAAHYSDFNNPHKTTAEQTGAIPILYPTSTDLNTELTMGGNRSTIHCYYEITLNTPYKEGKTDCTHGMVITNAHSESYGTQLCMPSGEDAIYVRRLNGGGISEWVKMANAEQLNTHIGDTEKHVGKAAGGGAFIGANSSANSGGGAVGYNAKTTGLGGFAGGDTATAIDGGGAIGYEAAATSGGGAIGFQARSTEGGAVGGQSIAGIGFAGGFYAATIDNAVDKNPIDAIQLGTGENTNERTLQVYGYQMMDANGKIPAERLPKPSGTYSGSGTNQNQTISIGGVGNILLISSSNNDIAFVHSTGAHSFPNNGSDFSIKESNAKFVNGVLTLVNNSYAGVNASGITYYYQVL